VILFLITWKVKSLTRVAFFKKKNIFLFLNLGSSIREDSNDG
jgi:hypothetical protein